MTAAKTSSTTTGATAGATTGEAPVIIKKYPNRRLYNTETSVYVTLDDLAELVKEGRDFAVHDAKTGDDLTRQVLTQIIFERESQGAAMLPTNFLRSLIHFYDDSLSTPLQHYLDASMQAFLGNQEKFRTIASRAMQDIPISPLTPLSTIPQWTQMEELARQNVAFFEKTMAMFNPFGALYKEEQGEGRKKK